VSANIAPRPLSIFYPLTSITLTTICVNPVYEMGRKRMKGKKTNDSRLAFIASGVQVAVQGEDVKRGLRQERAGEGSNPAA
jgi:hypothetical protein